MIGLAQQTGSNIQVYDDKGHWLFTVPGTLIGFTSSTVVVKIFENSNTLTVYDEHGHFLCTKTSFS